VVGQSKGGHERGDEQHGKGRLPGAAVISHVHWGRLPAAGVWVGAVQRNEQVQPHRRDGESDRSGPHNPFFGSTPCVQLAILVKIPAESHKKATLRRNR
jgi:hypothetical protein